MASSETPIPNRLCVVPQSLYDKIHRCMSDPDPKYLHYRLMRLVRISYSQGYMDGYRDGHTDAENGHDERVIASVT